MHARVIAGHRGLPGLSHMPGVKSGVMIRGEHYQCADYVGVQANYCRNAITGRYRRGRVLLRWGRATGCSDARLNAQRDGQYQ